MFRAFTLVELMVVVAIIALLMFVVFIGVFKSFEKAKISGCLADMKAIQTAAIHFYADVVEWPPGLADNQGTNSSSTDNAFTNNPYVAGARWEDSSKESLWRGPYLDKWPSQTPWGTQLQYLPEQHSGNDFNGDGRDDSYISLLPPIPVGIVKKLDEMIDGEINGSSGNFIHAGGAGWPASGYTTAPAIYISNAD